MNEEQERVIHNTSQNQSRNDNNNWKILMEKIISIDQKKVCLDRFENENVADLAKALEYAQRLVKLSPETNVDVAKLIFGKRTKHGSMRKSDKTEQEKKKELEDTVKDIRYFANKIEQYENDDCVEEFVVLCQFIAQGLRVAEDLIGGYKYKASPFPLNEMHFLLAAFAYGASNSDSTDVPPYALLINKKDLQQQVKIFVGYLEKHEWDERNPKKAEKNECPQTRFDVVQSVLSK